jgi:hypothetical protein
VCSDLERNVSITTQLLREKAAGGPLQPARHTVPTVRSATSISRDEITKGQATVANGKTTLASTSDDAPGDGTAANKFENLHVGKSTALTVTRGPSTPVAGVKSTLDPLTIASHELSATSSRHRRSRHSVTVINSAVGSRRAVRPGAPQAVDRSRPKWEVARPVKNAKRGQGAAGDGGKEVRRNSGSPRCDSLTALYRRAGMSAALPL